MSRIYMHRISYLFDISRALLNHNILSIGFNHQGIDIDNKFNKGEDVRREMLRLARDKTDVGGHRFGEYMNLVGYDFRGKWALWYFCRIEKGDLIVIPLWNGKFIVAEAKSEAMLLSDLSEEACPDKNLSGKRGLRFLKGKGIAYSGETEPVDLGFYIELDKVSPEFERRGLDGEKERALKYRGTTKELPSDFHEYFSGWLESGSVMAKDLHKKVFGSLELKILENFKNCSDRDFELLIQKYMDRLGADESYIPPKNSKKIDKDKWSDADVIVQFSPLKLVVFIQAKRHDRGSTSDKTGINQIKPFLDADTPDSEWTDYQKIAWVITSADFDDEAQKEADRVNLSGKYVRLINGSEFSRMLLDIGFDWAE